MKSFLLALGFAAVVPFSFIACGGDSASDVEDSCNAFVKEAESCDRDTSQVSGVCSSIAAEVEGTDCEGEAKDYLDCAKDNVCKDSSDTDGTVCETESDKLDACGEAFCKDHASDSRCSSSQSAAAGRSRVWSLSSRVRF